MQKYISYLRVSTDKQGISGLGLESQKQIIDQFISNSGGELVGEFEEIESGKVDSRPQLIEAIRESKRQKAKLVVAKLDRLTRDLAFGASLIKSVDFVVADSPNESTLSLQVKLVIAEEERRLISERTKQALQIRKDQGIKLGSPNPAKGSALGVKAKQEKAKAFALNVKPIIDQIIKSGIESLSGIAQQLQLRGIKTIRGGEVWHPQQIKNLMGVI